MANICDKTAITVDSLNNVDEGDEEPIDNNGESDASLEFGEESDDDFNFGLEPIGEEEDKEETKDEKSARQEQEKMELFWKLMDLGFSRERTAEALNEKGFRELSTATEYLLTTGNPDAFALENNAPTNHTYHKNSFTPFHAKNFNKAILRESNLLRSSLPAGIYVRGFEDRLDLYSVMMKGPKGTPYEDALFFFDIQLSSDYPRTAPKVNFIHYAGQARHRLNPNLYIEGKVCLSILGTWHGNGCENWDPNNSNLFQVLVSIQGLVLVSEPYYNEPGWERNRGTAHGTAESRKYNHSVMIEVLKSVIGQAQNPPDIFEQNTREHFLESSQQFVRRLESWFDITIDRSKGNLHEDVTNTQYGARSNPKSMFSGFLSEGLFGSDNSIESTDQMVSTITNKDVTEESKKSVKINTVLGSTVDFPPPEFPLLPVSKEFQSHVTTLIKQYENAVHKLVSGDLKTQRGS